MAEPAWAWLSTVVKIVSIAVTPILLFYAVAAIKSDAFSRSASYRGSFWNLVFIAVFMGFSELAALYFDVSGQPAARLISELARLAALVNLFLVLRQKLRESLHQRTGRK